MRWYRTAVPAVLVLLVMHGSGTAQGPPARWRLSARPSVTIGGGGMGRVMSLSGGEIVVLNGATREIRVFDRAGRYLRAMGRGGAGPGEFKNPDLLGHAGDTLFIADAINARITLFLVDGRLIKTIPITARDAAGRFQVVGRFRNGTWAVRTTSSPSLFGPQRTYRDTSLVGVLGADASGVVSWLGEFPGTTFFVYNPENAPHGDVVVGAPLGPVAVSAMSGDEVLIGDTGGRVIGAYSAGSTLRLIPVPLEAKPLTDERIGQLRQQALEQNRSERALPYLTALYSRAVMGRTLPVFSYVLSSPDGSLWVQQGPRDAAEPATWLVLDSRGEPKASVLVPPGFRITEVGPSHVLGVNTNADGVETVRMYQLASQ